MVKKIFRYLVVGVLLMFGILIVVGNLSRLFVETQQRERLKTLEGMVSEINRNLPMKIDANMDIGTMTHVFISDSSIIWRMKLDDGFFYPNRVSKLQPESVDAGLLATGTRADAIDLDTLLSAQLLKRNHRCLLMYYFLFAKQDKPNMFYEEIMRRGFSQRCILHSPFSDRLVEFELTAGEMKKMEEYCKFQKENAMAEFLRLYQHRQSDMLTVASANSDINMECLLNTASFIYRYTLGPEYDAGGNKPIQNCRELYAELCEDAREDFQTIPLFCSAKEIADKYNKSVIFRFRNNAMTDSIDFVVYNK